MTVRAEDLRHCHELKECFVRHIKERLVALVLVRTVSVGDEFSDKLKRFVFLVVVSTIVCVDDDP